MPHPRAVIRIVKLGAITDGLVVSYLGVTALTDAFHNDPFAALGALLIAVMVTIIAVARYQVQEHLLVEASPSLASARGRVVHISAVSQCVALLQAHYIETGPDCICDHTRADHEGELKATGHHTYDVACQHDDCDCTTYRPATGGYTDLIAPEFAAVGVLLHAMSAELPPEALAPGSGSRP